MDNKTKEQELNQKLMLCGASTCEHEGGHGPKPPVIVVPPGWENKPLPTVPKEEVTEEDSEVKEEVTYPPLTGEILENPRTNDNGYFIFVSVIVICIILLIVNNKK